MTRLLRTVLPAVLVVLAALTSLACGGGSSGDGASATDRLVIAIPSAPPGIDFDTRTNPTQWSVGGQVLEQGQDWKRVEYPFPPAGGIDNNEIEGFTYPALTEGELEGLLIERCELSKDAKRATYHLREGVKSNYGNEFTADDVLWRVRRSAANESIGAFMNSVAGAPDPAQYRKLNKYTVEITSDKPMPIVCEINANEFWTYLDSKEAKKHTTDEDPWANEWLSTHSASFGPYYITKWSPSREIILEAHKNYWRGEPKIKEIIYRIIPEESTRLSLLQSGEVDIAEALSPDSLGSLRDDAIARPVAVKGNDLLYLTMDNSRPPFDDVKVRQAVNHAIPREAIATEVFKGTADPWQGLIPIPYKGYEEVTDYSGGIERAQELLTEAGVEGFEVPLLYSASDPVQESIAVLLQTELKKIGIEVQPEKQPGPVWSERLASRKTQFAITNEFPIQPDINYDLTLFYTTDGTINYGNINSPAIDQAVGRGTNILDPDERLRVNKAAFPVITAEAPIGWMVSPYYRLGVSRRLSGIGWYTAQYYRVDRMTLKK